MDHKLASLIERARKHVMSDDEMMQQRVGFAFGNAPSNDTNTKETVMEAVRHARMVKSK